MPDKYSFAKCEQYGRRLAARLCDQHFNTSLNSTLDGPAVLGFTPVRQVNLLVVRQLLQQWQTEISRLRSPYFDFEAPAVQTALLQFQNTLSRYIRLTRAAFESLLAQAIADALRLVANPASAFEHLFLTQDKDSSTSELRNLLRYLDLNKEFFTSFMDTLPADDLLSNAVIRVQLLTYQNANYDSQQPVQQLVKALSILLPLTEADLLENGQAASLSIPSSPVPSTKLAPSRAATSVADSSGAPASIVEETALQPSHPTSILLSVPTHTEAPLYEKLKTPKSASTPLAAALRAAQSQPVPLAERGAPKVETLREAISINQRFSFINELFNGENMEYHAAIQHLDSLSEYEQAHAYIIQNLAQRYDWSRKEEHISKLLKLVERKFAQM